jgi:hypothetical protein
VEPAALAVGLPQDESVPTDWSSPAADQPLGPEFVGSELIGGQALSLPISFSLGERLKKTLTCGSHTSVNERQGMSKGNLVHTNI